MRSPGKYCTSIRRGFFTFAFLLLLDTLCCKSQNTVDSVHQFLQAKFNFSQSELSDVDGGKTVTKLLKTDDPAEVAVCAAVHLQVPPDIVVKRYREIETFKTGSAVPEVGRFSTPALPENLDRLTLENDDIDALRNCKPGACAVKLSGEMMRRFRTEIDWSSGDYRNRVAALMKQILIGYVESYRAGGNNSMCEYDDQRYSLFTADEFHEILQEEPNLFSYAPELSGYLERFPHDTLQNATDFIYWQKEVFEKIKPVISLNHSTVYTPVRGKANALIASKQIYANHYFEASLTMTALLDDGAQPPGFYALYLNRARFDDLRKKGVLDYRSRIRSEIYKRVQSELQWLKEHVQSLYQSREGK